jgi:GT2 family glycosyltransferase
MNKKPKNKYPLSGEIEYDYNYNPKVCFIMQYFKKPKLVKQIINNIRKIDNNLEIIIHNDSRENMDIFLKMLDKRNDRIILSNDLGEYYGYNTGAVLTNAEFLIIAQDDDIPPDTTKWWEEVMDKFNKDPKLGLINFFKGGNIYGKGVLPDRITANGKNGFKYTIWNAIGPFIVRRDAFMKCGMFDKKYFQIGECGGGADAALSTRMWLNGYKAAILDTKETIKYGRRIGGRTTERDGRDSIIRKNSKIRIELNDKIYLKEFESKIPDIVQNIKKLNNKK